MQLLISCAIYLTVPLGHALGQGIVRVMPLGDSITRGMGAGVQEIPGGYRDPLASLYASGGDSFLFVGSQQTTSSPGLVAINQQHHEGYGGYRIDNIQSSIDNWQASALPDVVLLHIGTNDILQYYNLGTGGNDTSYAIARLITLIGTLYTNNPDLEIVLSTLIPIQNGSDELVKNYNAALSSVVIPTFINQGKTIVLVDNYANFINVDSSWNTTLFADFAHPNALGYSAMADAFYTVPLPQAEGIVFAAESAAGGIDAWDGNVAINLMRAGESSLVSVSAPTSSLNTIFPLAGLNDGSAAGNGNYTYYSLSEAGVSHLPATITFELDTSVNYRGYDIDSVQAITGWGDHNLGAQRFQLFLAKGNEGYIDYGLYDNSGELTGGSGSYLSTVSHTSGVIAKNITGVRFVFLNPDQSNGAGNIGNSQLGSSGGTLIQELQVFGAASATSPPTVSILSPADDAGNVPVSSDLVVTFDKAIAIGTGNITIKDLDTPSQTVIAVGDAQVSVSGAVLTITPTIALDPSTNYAIQIDATAIDDSFADNFAGITDDTTWSFTTGSLSLSLSEFSGTLLTYADDVSASDLLHGLAPIITGWNTSNNASPLELTDGIHGVGVVSGDIVQGAWTTVGATAEYDLGLSPGGTGWDITSIQSIADWQDSGFGNQAWTVEVKSVGGAYTTLATIDYQPLGSGGGTSKVTLTDPSGLLASGVEFIKLTANQVNGGAFVWRELDVFGVSSNSFRAYISDPAFGLDPADQGFDDDPDGDNLANGLEAWFGLHPGQFDAGLSAFSTDGTTISYEHPQNETVPGEVTGFYEWSPNLIDWFASGNGPIGGPTVSFVPTTVGITTTVTATASEELEQLFLRVGVLQN